MSSFSCTLTVAGKDWPVVLCSYEFDQLTTEEGRATAKVRSGFITMHLDVPDDNALLEWAASPYKKHSGQLVFFNTNAPTARERLIFTDAFCVSYEESFWSGATQLGSYRCILRISAAKLTLGAAQKLSEWADSR